MLSIALVLLGVANVAALRCAPAQRSSSRRDSTAALSDELKTLPAVDPYKGAVSVEKDAVAVGTAVWDRIELSAARAIEARGAFALAIPGGSVLKMLAGSKPPWASKAVVAYVNHKAVDNSDEQLATHAKAWKGFLNDWEGVEVITLEGSSDAVTEAAKYAEKLERCTRLPRTPELADGDILPIFDMVIVGVGDDGHIGSLYPNREDVLDDYSWTLPVEMKTPGSITMSLPVIANGREVLVAACGVSEKYPEGKSAAMRRAIQTEETLKSFPAAGLREVATYIFDVAAASKLDKEYQVMAP